MPVTLRTARDEDLDEILAVFRDSVLSVREDAYTPEHLRSWATSADRPTPWRERIRTQHFLLAADERVQGFCSLGEDGYIDVLYVRPAARGKGVAGVLLAAIEAEAARRGVTTVWSDASLPAQRFFARQGYEAEPYDKRVGALVYPNAIVRKALRARDQA